MGVIKTDEWLMETDFDPIKLCEKISKYFDTADLATHLHQHLSMHGMYRKQPGNQQEWLKNLKANHTWEMVQKELNLLKKQWNGPKVSVFILPSDEDNPELQRNYNGKSGLSFNDKLFLFLSESNTNTEIKALLTHEYNHSCRLNSYKKAENDYVLLDTIILEGLAERAVLERFGDAAVARWVHYYSEQELEKYWKDIIYPLRDIPVYLQKHQHILHGLKFYPKKVGYCVGFHLVRKFMDENKISTKEMLHLSSDKIAQL